MEQILQAVASRPFKSDADFWRVRDLLVRTYPLIPSDWNWDTRRWDGWRFYDADLSWRSEWEKVVRLWETAERELVGVVHGKHGNPEFFLQLHPDYRHLIEEEMVQWAEENLAVSTEDGSQQHLQLFVYDYDLQRRRLLTSYGYEQMSSWEVIRRLRFGNVPLAQPQFHDGYRMCTTRPGDREDAQRIADLLNVAFNRDFHNPEEYLAFTRNSPCFRNDLDLVAVAPDGSFASYVGVLYEEQIKHGLYEPVCTHPDHRRKGLAQALMFEGLIRLKALGATDAYVATGEMVPANGLYDSIGFTEIYKGHTWRKVW